MLGKFLVPGLPTIRMIERQGPTALVVSAGAGCLDIFTILYFFSRDGLKYCLKGRLNSKQPTNKPIMAVLFNCTPVGLALNTCTMMTLTCY